jgi:hypothetical protein
LVVYFHGSCDFRGVYGHIFVDQQKPVSCKLVISLVGVGIGAQDNVFIYPINHLPIHSLF